MDLAGLTNEQLSDLLNAGMAEQQKRQKDARLKAGAWSLVMDAKNHGYTRGQVTAYLQQVIKEAYGEPSV